MKKILTFFALSLFVPLFSFAGDYTEVTAEELVNMKKEGKIVIVDARGEKYLDGRIIDGAALISADNINEESLSKVASKEDKIVFYCSNVNCPASAKAAAKATSLGFTHVYKYPGGIDEWAEKGLPIQEL